MYMEENDIFYAALLSFTLLNVHNHILISLNTTISEFCEVISKTAVVLWRDGVEEWAVCGRCDGEGDG